MSSCFTSSSTTTTADHGAGETTISAVHEDIIQTHILTRLDGPTLAAAACASSQLQVLSSEDKLWQKICTATWPSINDPRVSHLISTFPAGHRSFFSDSFLLLDHRRPSKQSSDKYSSSSVIITTELISCVDVYYKDVLILSKTREMETVTGWFICSPFRVDLLDPKESVSTPILHGGEEDDTWLKDLEENLSVSWILIDPERKRAVNISSRRAVTVERHWLTGDVQARFSLIMGGDQRSGMELVKWEVAVTCGGDKELQVREVSLQVEDMEGRGLSGWDSLVILQEALEKGKRKREIGNEGKVRYLEFLERKRELKFMKLRREKVLDMACMALGITIFLSFWGFILFR
ncbi:hypothetical protein Dsin_019694 [Dipteronia sinensis]|uniref:F-box protein n=1 Tax=Dipteronia sinensis TaxID=43782 RepID=A0AAE0E324_9ROSI|nr:hypothetical protein Dsin_019694 [Dipteronia sinensis]